MSPAVLGRGGPWQCHPGFSRLSRCCFWWRIDNNYLGASLFFSPCVSRARPPFSLYCWSQDPIYCRCLHHPSHLAVMFCARVGSVSMERLCSCCTCVGMPRGRAFPRSSCCVSASEFLQRLSAQSPLKLPLRSISSIFRLAVYIDVVGRSGPQRAL